jgi:surfeit locus 1 family protein
MQKVNWRAVVLTTTTALVVVVTAALGTWQLGRADQKNTLQSLIDSRANEQPWGNADVLTTTAPDDGLHRRVTLQGVWQSDATVLLDNRPMGGQVGFWVISPLRLSGSERVVLVNRGWVARDFMDRTRIPPFETPVKVVELQGRLTPPVSALYELAPAPPGPMRQNVLLADYARETGLDFLPITVVQTDPSAGGLSREWPFITAKVHTHYGYAAQWFSLSALCAGLYLWFQWIAPRRKRNPHGKQAR